MFTMCSDNVLNMLHVNTPKTNANILPCKCNEYVLSKQIHEIHTHTYTLTTNTKPYSPNKPNHSFALAVKMVLIN